MAGQPLIQRELRAENATLKKKIRELEAREEERGRAEQALEEQSKLLRIISKHMSDLLALTDIHGTILFVGGYHSILGHRRDGILGTNVVDLVHPDDRSRVEEALSAAMRDGGRKQTVEYRYRALDGSYVWLETVGDAVRHRDGSIKTLIFNSRDITERKRAAETLRESEEKYRTLVETAAEAIFIIQGDTIRFCNRIFTEITGYQMETVDGTPAGDMVHPDDRPLVFNRYRQRAAGEDVPSRYSFRFIDAWGNTRWADMNVALVSWEGKPAALCLATDITESKQIEEALRASEEKFRHLFERAEEGILIARGDVLEFVNPALERILGHPADALTATPFTSFIHPDDRAAVRNRHIRRMRGEILERRYDFRVVTRDGTVKWVTIHSQVIDWEGAPANLVFVTDITDRRRAEEEREKLQAQLQQARRLEAVGTLAGGIAHDFNNLLMGIQGNTSLMMHTLDPSHPHHERLRHVEESVASAAALTKQLLGFSQGGRYDVKPHSMNELIEKTSALFGRTKKELSIHRTYSTDPCVVEGDRSQMDQVFMNLFVNAWQAMPGGGDLFIETEMVVFEQTPYESVPPGRYVKVKVTDTGTGMDGQTKERIFDPFFTTKGMGRGTGLGLATVYGIVKGHGGMISVESEPGHGTTFTLYLPASLKDPAGERATAGDVLKGTETILLVDDEHIVLEVTTEMLESLGYSVLPAASGQEALAVYTEKKDAIDLVILDMIMPGISGCGTFDKLREINPAVKVLLASGYSINGQAQEILDRGCDGFIQKPFTLDGLSRSVREKLEQQSGLQGENQSVFPVLAGVT